MDREKHIRVIAWIHLVLGGLVLFTAALAFVSVLLGGLFSGQIVATLASPVVAIITAIAVGIFSIPALLAGKGLLEGKGWARVLAMVLAVFHFAHFPLGSAFCIYSFWILWASKADPHFERSYPRYHEYE